MHPHVVLLASTQLTCTSYQLAKGLCHTPPSAASTASAGGGLLGFLGLSWPNILTGLAGSAACGHTITSVFELVVVLIGQLVSYIAGAVWAFAMAILTHTLLNPSATTVVLQDVRWFYAATFGLVAALAGLAFAYRVLRWQLENISGSRRETAQQLAGRVLTVFAWLAALKLVFLNTLLPINDLIVARLDHAITFGGLTAQACSNPYGEFAAHVLQGAAVGAGLGGAFLASVFFGPVVALVALGLVFYVLIAWLLRLFEMVFWAAVAPIALALTIADPQERLWQYVKSQLVGAIFLQAVMAFGLWIITQLFWNHIGFNPNAKVSLVSLRFLNLGIALVGFWFVAQLPRYWREANGHTTAGGLDAAQVALGYMGGRLGLGLLRATPGGQLLGAATEALGARSTAGLATGTSVAGRLLGASGAYRQMRTGTAFNTALAKAHFARDKAARPDIANWEADAALTETAEEQRALRENRLAEYGLTEKGGLAALARMPLSPGNAASFAQALQPYLKGAVGMSERLAGWDPAQLGAIRTGRDAKRPLLLPRLRTTSTMAESVAEHQRLAHLVDTNPVGALTELFEVSEEQLAQPETQRTILAQLSAWAAAPQQSGPVPLRNRLPQPPPPRPDYVAD